MTSTIWAVDDEPDVLLSLGGLLEDAGFAFRGFEDPLEFCQAIEDGGRPDIAVVDLNLPNLSGAEVIKRIRSQPTSAEFPIVVLTALASEGSLLNAFEAGADDVVRKPYSLSEFLARITWQLSRTRRLQKLRRKNQDLMLLTELAQTMSREAGLAPVLDALVAGLEGAVEGAQATIYLVDKTDELVAFAEDGEPHRTLDLRDARGAREALAGRFAATFHGEEAVRLGRAIGREDPEMITSATLQPLVVRGTFVGVLAMTSDERDLGKERESYLLSIVSDFAALAVHRSQLLQSMIQERERIDEANLELARTRDFLTNVIDSSPDAIVVSDKQGQIVVFNAAAERILGFSRSEAIGSDVRELYPDSGAERVRRMLMSERFGGRGRLESQRTSVVDRDGMEVPVLISASTLEEYGEEVATVGVFTDLRRQIEMEERLQEATESLERSRRKALIVELAGAAAHELNQPLTSLLGYAELMDSRMAAEDDNRRALQTILSEAHRIADVVRKIGRITQYRTKEYVGGTRIVDLDGASGIEEVTEVVDSDRTLEQQRETASTGLEDAVSEEDGLE